MCETTIVNSYSDVPKDERCIFVTLGRKDEVVRQGNRIIVSVNPEALSDRLAEIVLRIAIVEFAKIIAARERMSAIYVCNSIYC